MMQRPRRNRSSSSIRDLVSEKHLHPHNFIWPVFLIDGLQKKESISALPGIYRWSVDLLVNQIKEALSLGIKAFAIFPKVGEGLKNSTGSISLDTKFFLYSALRRLREEVPEALLITDVALDP